MTCTIPARVQEKLPIGVLVFNTACTGRIRMHQERLFSRRVVGTYLSNPDFVAGRLLRRSVSWRALEGLPDAPSGALGQDHPRGFELEGPRSRGDHPRQTLSEKEIHLRAVMSGTGSRLLDDR